MRAVLDVAVAVYVLGCLALGVPLFVRLWRAKRSGLDTDRIWWSGWVIACVVMLWPIAVAVALARRPRTNVMTSLWLFACGEADRPTYAALSVIGCIVGGVAYVVFDSALIAIPVGLAAAIIVGVVVKPRRSVRPR